MADTARDEADEHLARLRLGEVELLNLERLPEPLEYGGVNLHGTILIDGPPGHTGVPRPGATRSGRRRRAGSARGRP